MKYQKQPNPDIRETDDTTDTVPSVDPNAPLVIENQEEPEQHDDSENKSNKLFIIGGVIFGLIIFGLIILIVAEFIAIQLRSN